MNFHGTRLEKQFLPSRAVKWATEAEDMQFLQKRMSSAFSFLLPSSKCDCIKFLMDEPRNRLAIMLQIFIIIIFNHRIIHYIVLPPTSLSHGVPTIHLFILPCRISIIISDVQTDLL